ncbi:MAG: phosphotransferase [Faecalibacterium sp.]
MSGATVAYSKETKRRSVFTLSGRIDSNNAAKVEQELLALRKAHPQKMACLDAEGLEYISSAGLRVLMRLRKAEPCLEVCNVSPAVYDVLEMTGFLTLLNVKKAMRTISVEGCEVIGRGGQGTVYRLDKDTVVKVYNPGYDLEASEKEQQCAKAAFINGIPTAISYDVVRCGEDQYGIAYEMIHSDTLAHAYLTQPERFEELTQQYVDFVRSLQQNHLPRGVFESFHEMQNRRVDRLAEFCAPEETELLRSLIAEMRDADEPVHGDLHPGNIMIQDGEMLLIDMSEMTTGPAGFDIGGIYRDLLLIPQRDKALSERLMGMPQELTLRIANRFFQLYTGITDPAQLQAYYKKLIPLACFSMFLVMGRQNIKALAHLIPKAAQAHLRGVVIPNEKDLRELLRSL